MKKKKAELAALGEWSHINCLKPAAQSGLIDDVLRSILYKPPAAPQPPSVKESEQIAQPKSRVEMLLAAIDLSNLNGTPEPSDEIMNVKDVPGGTVSFVFERTSENPDDEEEEVAQASS
jgi:DNA repair and recombination protein RAD54B